MKERIKFISNEIRNDFFEKVRNNSGLNWNQISRNLKINRKLLGEYRSGKLTLPENIYLNLLCYLNKQEKESFSKNTFILNPNWGRVKGGILNYKKNKHLFEEGRKKAIASSKNKANKFDINLPLSSDIAYFIGLFIGDGFTNKYNRSYIVQFTGHLNHEKDFYENYISKIVNDLFNLNPKIRYEDKINTLRFNIYSKDLFRLITQRFKIKPGFKSRDVIIPDEILNSDYIFDCIAGLFDAEGSIYFDKRNRYKEDYIIFNFHVNNPFITKQIITIFEKEKLPFSYTKDYKKIYCYGEENVKKLLERIPMKNPKILNKLK